MVRLTPCRATNTLASAVRSRWPMIHREIPESGGRPDPLWEKRQQHREMEPHILTPRIVRRLGKHPSEEGVFAFAVVDDFAEAWLLHDEYSLKSARTPCNA